MSHLPVDQESQLSDQVTAYVGKAFTTRNAAKKCGNKLGTYIVAVATRNQSCQPDLSLSRSSSKASIGSYGIICSEIRQGCGGLKSEVWLPYHKVCMAIPQHRFVRTNQNHYDPWNLEDKDVRTFVYSNIAPVSHLSEPEFLHTVLYILAPTFPQNDDLASTFHWSTCQHTVYSFVQARHRSCSQHLIYTNSLKIYKHRVRNCSKKPEPRGIIYE